MGPFELIEKLINEHGSAALLREQLALVKAQQAALEGQCRDLQTNNAKLQAALDEHQQRLAHTQQELHAARDGLLATNVCGHCGGARLQRTGTRAHPVFGPLGLQEAVLRCADCGQDTFIELRAGR